MKNWTLRQVYLYLVTFVSLMILIAGLISTIMAVSDFFIPRPYYSPGPADIYTRFKSMEGRQDIPREIIEEQIEFEKEQARNNMLYSIYQNLKRGVAFVLVALPIWLYHWRRIQFEFGQQGAEKGT